MIQAIVVVGLASFYVTYTVRYLEGPFGAYHRILSWLGIHRVPVLDDIEHVVDYVEEYENMDSFITKLVRCFWCLTTWICLAFTVIYGLLVAMSVEQLFLVWLASAGLSGWLFERVPDGTSE